VDKYDDLLVIEGLSWEDILVLHPLQVVPVFGSGSPSDYVFIVGTDGRYRLLFIEVPGTVMDSKTIRYFADRVWVSYLSQFPYSTVILTLLVFEFSNQEIRQSRVNNL
jgi:hypothetical protein